MDRRHHKRFDLQTPVSFSWVDAQGARVRGKGITRDISETGVFVLSPDCPSAGVAVNLEVHSSVLAASGLMMHTCGEVVRLEPVGALRNAEGFAVATRSLKLRGCKPALTRREPEYRFRSPDDTATFPSHSRKPQ